MDSQILPKLVDHRQTLKEGTASLNVTLSGHRNHRMAEVGRDLWRSSCSTPLLKQGHLEPVDHDCIRVAFEYLQGWRVHKLPRQPHSEVFCDVQSESPVFHFVPTASCHTTGHH